MITLTIRKKEQLRKYEKEVKRVVCVNFDDEKKSI